MSPIKTLARESYFLASIFSKTLFSLFKTLGQQLVVLVILEILRLFWLIKRFRGGFFLHIFFWYFGNFSHFRCLRIVLEIGRAHV